MSDPQQPDLNAVIGNAKANFYAMSGQTNVIFENLIGSLLRELSQRDRIISDLQKILEDKKPQSAKKPRDN
jgi:regulatory protein YycI of two-component signal transduction system YycFG